MNRQKIRKAYESVRPDEESQDRMLHHILLGASEIAPEGKDDTMKHKRMRPMMLVAVIALVAAMTVTVFASEVITGWFKQYFEKQNDIILTKEQVQYIEENEQILDQVQIQNGYSLKLKSVIADRNTLYVTLGITAPSALPFDNAHIITLDGFGFYDQDRNWYQGNSIEVVDDADGLDTTADIMVKLSEGNWNHGGQWTLQIEKLVTLVHDIEYEQELLDSKYAGQENILFTDEESEKIYWKETVAEGPWEFTIDMGKVDAQELEITTEPITTQSCYGFKADGTLVYKEAVITSVTIRPLSVTFYGEPSKSGVALDIAPTAREEIFVAMKDGSRIDLKPRFSSPGEERFEAISPIVLEEVAYVQIPDGTKIMAP